MGKTGKMIGHIIGNIVAAFISLIVIIPLVVLFLNSFKTSAEANKMTLSLPAEWMFENYATVIEQGKLVSSFFKRASLCNLQCSGCGYSGFSSIFCNIQKPEGC